MIKASFFLEDQKLVYPDNFISNPKISVILPTYCRGSNGLLERSIKSVLGQTFKDFELIVVDDGSRDMTARVIASFQKEDNRVLHVRHETNSGLPALRVNEGLMLARGKYIAYQFDDDQWEKDSLEILFNAITVQNQPSLVYGKGKLNFNGSISSIGDQFNFSRLIESNYIANNSVLHPRSFVHEQGGYDSHILMRRLCDWDLWIRWARHYPFIYVDAPVSIIEAGVENSIGTTVPFDLNIFRWISGLSRNERLRLSILPDYDIENINFLRPYFTDEAIDDIYRRQILPWLLQHRWKLSNKKLQYSFKSQGISILVTKFHYDTTVDITVNNFNEANKSDNCINFFFIPTQQIEEDIVSMSDVLLLHRTCDNYSSLLQDYAIGAGKPVAYMLDDHLLSFYELGEEFSYLTPGTPTHNALIKQITDADLVISYSPIITESVRELNPRVINIRTNILEKYMNKNDFKKKSFTPLRIVFAGGTARLEEFSFLWPALQAFSEEKKELVEFYFWGLDPKGFPPLKSPTYFVPFTFSYKEYIERLMAAGFDIMLVPLFDDKVAKKAKCPIKYLEATAAACIGIYSDTVPYRNVEHKITGIKAQNTVQHWLECLEIAYNMCPEDRYEMLCRARDGIIENYTTESQLDNFFASIEALKLHEKSRDKRHADGLLRIAYFCHSPYLGGAENHLFRHAKLAHQFGFRPVWCIPENFRGTNEKMVQIIKEEGYELYYLPYTFYTEPTYLENLSENKDIELIMNWMESNKIFLVHSVTFIPHVAQATRLMGIPHIASVYAFEDVSCNFSGAQHAQAIHSDSLFYANRWAKVLKIKSRCIRSWVPDSFFGLGKQNLQKGDNKKSNFFKIGMSGSLQERKGQLEAIAAVGTLKNYYSIELHLYGYSDFFPEYKKRCVEMATRLGISDRVIFHGFIDKPEESMSKMDAFLCASTSESFPQAVLESMAMGIPVVSTSIAGIPELIIDGVTGILIQDNSPEKISKGLENLFNLSYTERDYIVTKAFEIAKEECREDRVAKDLLSLYNDACDIKARLYTSREEKECKKLGTSVRELLVPVEQNRSQDHALLPSPIVKKSRSYLVSFERNNLNGICVMFGTHRRINMGTLKIKIFARGMLDEPLRINEIPLESLNDNEWYMFTFEKICNSKGTFIIQFEISYRDKASGISIYEWQPHVSSSRKFAGKIFPLNKSLYFKAVFVEE